MVDAAKYWDSKKKTQTSQITLSMQHNNNKKQTNEI
jgi:hypothetical protein